MRIIFKSIISFIETILGLFKRDKRSALASEITIENMTVSLGETFLATVRVKNTGDLKEEQTITMDFGNEETVDSKTITLEGGEEIEFDFEYEVPMDFPTGTTTVTVWTDNESDTVDIEVVEDIYFAVNINENTSDVSVIAGEDLNVYVDIENQGSTTGTQTITFHIDGSEKDSKTVTLQGKESRELNFSYDVPEEFKNNKIDITISSDDEGDYYTIDVLSSAYFEIEIIEIQSELTAGDVLEVDASVTNKGEDSGKVK